MWVIKMKTSFIQFVISIAFHSNTNFHSVIISSLLQCTQLLFSFIILSYQLEFNWLGIYIFSIQNNFLSWWIVHYRVGNIAVTLDIRCFLYYTFEKQVKCFYWLWFYVFNYHIPWREISLHAIVVVSRFLLLSWLHEMMLNSLPYQQKIIL